MLAGICLRTNFVESLQNTQFLYLVLPPTALLSSLSFQEKAAQRWQGTDGAMALSHWTLARQADILQETKCVSYSRKATENVRREKNQTISPPLQANSKKGSFQNSFVNNKQGTFTIGIGVADTKHVSK